MNVYEKIKNMSISDMAEFLRVRFDDEGGSRVAGIGCGGCVDYETHHYPKDCGECIWLDVETDFKKWLELKEDIEDNEFIQQ